VDVGELNKGEEMVAFTDDMLLLVQGKMLIEMNNRSRT